MAWVNHYNCLNASGTTLTDSIGTNNGTLAGSPNPSINANGYLNFIGNHGATLGNRERVELTATDFQYTYDGTFSIISKFRYGALTNGYFGCVISQQGDSADPVKFFHIYYYQNASYCVIVDVRSANYKQTYQPSMTAGKLYNIIISYNNNVCYIMYNGKLMTLIIDAALTGNIYATNNKATLGAIYRSATANYGEDFKGDIFMAANKNDAMSIGAMKTYDAYLRGCV